MMCFGMRFSTQHTALNRNCVNVCVGYKYGSETDKQSWYNSCHFWFLMSLSISAVRFI